MAAGAALFGEPVSRTGKTGVARTAITVGLQALTLGELWVSGLLTLSLCGYGIVRGEGRTDTFCNGGIPAM